MLSCFCFPVRCCLRSAWCLASRDLTSRTTTQRCLAWINTSFPGSSRCLIQHYMTLVFSEHTHTLSLLESPGLPFLLCSRFLTAMFVLCSSYQTEETGRALCEEDAIHQPHLPPRQEHDIPRQLLLHHQRLGANAWEWVMMSLQLRSPVIEEETV